MATPLLDQVISGQQLAPGINNNGEAARPAFLFGRRASTTVLLTRGYYGGVGLIGSVLTTIPHGTLTLAASATNYMEVNPATLTPSVNSTGWTGGFIPIAKIVTDASGIVSDDSVLAFAFQGAAAGSYSLPISSASVLGGVKVGAGLSINATTGVLTATSGGGGASLSATNVWTKNQSVVSVALTDAATITADAALSNNFKVTLAGNRTLANMTNLTDGMVINLRVKQDATGSRTLAYGTMFKWPGGVVPVLSTAAGSVDRFSFIYDGTDGVLEGNILKAFA